MTTTVFILDTVGSVGLYFLYNLTFVEHLTLADRYSTVLLTVHSWQVGWVYTLLKKIKGTLFNQSLTLSKLNSWDIDLVS